MAKKSETGSNSPQTTAVKEQEGDVLLLLDKVEQLLQAVSRLNKNGSYQTVPADAEHQDAFMRINQNESILENGLKNFWRQLKDPTKFKLFRLKKDTLDEPKIRKALKDIAEGKQTAAAKAFLKKYEIVPKEELQQAGQTSETVAKQDRGTMQMSAVGNAQPRYRFNEAMINWGQLEAFGLSRSFLQEKGILDQLLRGYKTNQLVPISMNFGVVSLRTDARLSLQSSYGGPLVLHLHTIRQKPELDRPYFGHIFSEEDKRNLRETGNMGRVVELRTRDGGYVPAFVSLDRQTNELVSMRAENVYIPDEIKGVQLSEHEKNELREGRSVFLEGMIGSSGKEFDATVQISADRRGIEYFFDNNRLFNSQTLGGVQLTQKQIEDLNAGRAIFVEDMTRTDGELFSSFVKLDEASGRPLYTRYNPDTPENDREIYVPKVIAGARLTEQDRQELREGKAVFVENMLTRSGEERSAFVKLDLKTGQPSYSQTQNGFTERQEFQVPQEIWGVKLNAAQRAGLQSGKAVLVEGMTGFDGKRFSSYVKVNQRQGFLDYYNENPDRRHDASRRNVVEAAQKQQQEKRQSRRQGSSRGRGVN